MSPGIALSVIIPTRDRVKLLEGALRSLTRHLPETAETIVVDSASRDPYVARVGEGFGIKTVRLEVPGTSRARNAGLRETTGAIVAFIDDDCVVSPAWAEELQRAFADPRIGFITGRVEADRQAKSPVSVVIGSDRRMFHADADFSRMGGSVNIAFRREALESIGGFDEGMGPATRIRSAEDHDVIWRLLRAGWEGAYEPTVVVTHQQWRSTGAAIRREFAYGIGAGALAVKMIRLRDPRGWKTLRARFWADGLAMSASNLRRGYESGAVGAAFKSVGVLVGAIRASRVPIIDGHFRP